MAKARGKTTKKTAKKTTAAKTTKAAKAPAAPAKFEGFPKDAMQFWHELASEMNKEWFAANKERYESVWVTPMLALLGEVTEKLRPAYKPLALGAPKVMRIYRDVRFSKDKAPYKTHISGVITLAGKTMTEGGNAAMYLHVGIDEEFVGVGCYMFDTPRLEKWRKLVAGKPGEDLARTIAKLRGKGYVVGGHDDYKRVPKPYAEDHPRIELLKMKGLTGGFPEIPKGMLHKADLAPWLVEHGKAMAPIVTWLHKHVG